MELHSCYNEMMYKNVKIVKNNTKLKSKTYPFHGASANVSNLLNPKFW